MERNVLRMSSTLLSLCVLQLTMMSCGIAGTISKPFERIFRSIRIPTIHSNKLKSADNMWLLNLLKAGDDDNDVITLFNDHNTKNSQLMEDASGETHRHLLKQKEAFDAATGSRAIQPNWAYTSRSAKIELPWIKRGEQPSKVTWSKWWSSKAFPLQPRTSGEVKNVGSDEQSLHDSNSSRPLRYGK